MRLQAGCPGGSSRPVLPLGPREGAIGVLGDI